MEVSIKTELKTAVHKKTGNIYFVLDDSVLDCTNSRDGNRVVLYYREGKTFARDYTEFVEKFDYKG